MTFRLPDVREVLIRAGYSPAEVERRAREILEEKRSNQHGTIPTAEAPPSPTVVRGEDVVLARKLARSTVELHIAQLRAQLGRLPEEHDVSEPGPSSARDRRERVSSILNRMRLVSEILQSTEGICWVYSESGPRSAISELEQLVENLLRRVPREALSASQRELLDDRVLFELSRVRERERDAPSLTPQKNTERSQEIWAWRREQGLPEGDAFLAGVLNEAWDQAAVRAPILGAGPHPFPAREGSSAPQRLSVAIPLETGAAIEGATQSELRPGPMDDAAAGACVRNAAHVAAQILQVRAPIIYLVVDPDPGRLSGARPLKAEGDLICEVRIPPAEARACDTDAAKRLAEYGVAAAFRAFLKQYDPSALELERIAHVEIARSPRELSDPRIRVERIHEGFVAAERFAKVFVDRYWPSAPGDAPRSPP